MKNYFRIVLVGFAMVLVNQMYSTVFARSVYSDVPDTHTYASTIEYLTSLGAISGNPDGSFQPERTLNRAEFSKILVNMRPKYFEEALTQCRTSRYGSIFTDVQNSHWFYDVVCAMKLKGVIQGYDDGSFRAGEPLSVLAAVKMSLRTYDVHVDEDSVWFRPYINKAEQLGILPVGINIFLPGMKRGEMTYLLASLDKHPLVRPDFPPTVILNTPSGITTNAADVSWSASDPEGKSLTTRLCVSQDRNQLEYDINCQHRPSGNSYHITGLRSATWYYWVAKVSDGKTEITSLPGSFYVQEVKNISPTIVLANATSISQTSATLQWGASDPDSTNLTFSVCYSKNSTTLLNSCYKSSGKTYYANGLEPNSWYYWTARVSDGSTTVTAPMALFLTLQKANANPVITLNSTYGITTNQATGSWSASDADGNALSYRTCITNLSSKIYSDDVCSGWYNTTSFNAYTFGGLQSNTKYYWFIKVSDGKMIVTSTYNTFTTKSTTNNVPIATVSYTITGKNDITLNWVTSDIDGDNVTTEVCYSTSSSNAALNCPYSYVGLGTKSTLITGLVPGTTYYYVFKLSDGKNTVTQGVRSITTLSN